LVFKDLGHFFCIHTKAHMQTYTHTFAAAVLGEALGAGAESKCLQEAVCRAAPWLTPWAAGACVCVRACVRTHLLCSIGSILFVMMQGCTSVPIRVVPGVLQVLAKMHWHGGILAAICSRVKRCISWSGPCASCNEPIHLPISIV